MHSLALVLGLGAPTGVSVHWEAPPECPDAAAVREEISVLTEDNRARGSINGVITPTWGGYKLRLRVVTSAGEQLRELHNPDCSTLGRAAALIYSVAVAPLDAAVAVASQDDPVPEPPPYDEPAPPAVVAPSPSPRGDALLPGEDAPRRRLPHHGVLGLSGGIGVGMVPAVDAQFRGYVGWSLRRVRVEAIAFHAVGRERKVNRDAGVRASLTGGGLRGCFVLPAWPVEVPFCAGADVGALIGRGVGSAVDSQRVRDLWVAAAAGAGIAWTPWPVFALRVQVEGFVSLRRPGVHLMQGAQPRRVYRSQRGGFTGLVGVEFRLP